MTDVLVDTSIVVKWFHADGERDVEESRALLEAHLGERLVASVLDLTMYELGNVLVGALGRTADQVASVLRAVDGICETIVLDDGARRGAAALAIEHRLSFYDAAYAAAAMQRGHTLITADGALLEAGLGESAPAIVRRLGLA